MADSSEISRQSPVRSGHNLTKVRLFLHPQQRSNFTDGLFLMEYFEKTGLISQALDLEDVRLWIMRPETYPDKYKRKAIVLWGSFLSRSVPYMIWSPWPEEVRDGRVVVHWDLIERPVFNGRPGLFAR